MTDGDFWRGVRPSGSSGCALFAAEGSLAGCRLRPSAWSRCFLPSLIGDFSTTSCSGVGRGVDDCAGSSSCTVAMSFTGAGKSLRSGVVSTRSVDGAGRETESGVLLVAISLPGRSPFVISACRGKMYPAAAPRPPHANTMGSARARLTRRFVESPVSCMIAAPIGSPMSNRAA